MGFATYGPFRYRQGYKYTVEHSVHIKETFRGMGIGKNLLVKIIEKAKNENYHSIIGGIDCSNKVSLNLHEKLGFVQVAKIPEVAFKFDKWLDLCLLQKRL